MVIGRTGFTAAIAVVALVVSAIAQDSLTPEEPTGVEAS
jgi:hypothetical protein